MLRRLTSKRAVEQAMDECDRVGREAFLAKYGFGPARAFFVLRGARRYDSKAIVGVAYGYQFPSEGPLGPHDFSGGEKTVRGLLENLGYTFSLHGQPTSRQHPPRSIASNGKSSYGPTSSSVTLEYSVVERARNFFRANESNPLVLRRRKRNVEGGQPIVDRERAWSAMVYCLISTQQKAGPGSPMARFAKSDSPVLCLADALKIRNLATFAAEELSGAGLRRGPSIGRELGGNLALLEGGAWDGLLGILNSPSLRGDRQRERNAAHLIDRMLRGFGPKQSRNLLQVLGLSMHEVPIDSRLTKWFEAIGFPMSVDPKVLSSERGFDLVSDAFQALAARIPAIPCVLDAAIFSSFDEQWSDEDIIC